MPSKYTIVRAIGRRGYRVETTKQSGVGTEVTLGAVLKAHKEKTVFHVRKVSSQNP